MFTHLGVKLALYLLNNKALTIEDSNRCMEVVLKDLGNLQINDIIKIDDQQQLVINGNPLTMEQVIQLRESAIAALNNRALNIIRDQVSYAAVTYGVHKALTPEQMFFARAALWYGQEEVKLLETLAQRNQEPAL